MTEREKRVTIFCLTSEIEAFDRELRRRGPKRDHWGDPQFDVAAEHLRLLQSARALITRIKVDG